MTGLNINNIVHSKSFDVQMLLSPIKSKSQYSELQIMKKLSKEFMKYFMILLYLIIYLIMSIVIKQISARLTNDQQLFGNMSPYVLFTTGNQTKKTSVHDNGGKTPYWADTIMIPTRDNSLFIQIYDKDMVNDDLIGSASLSLNKYYSMPNVPQKQQIQLSIQSRSAGRITFSIQFQSGGNINYPIGNNMNQNWQVPPVINPNINMQNPYVQPNQQWGNIPNSNQNWNTNQFNKGGWNPNQPYNNQNWNTAQNNNNGWNGQQNYNNQWGNTQTPIMNPNTSPLGFNPLQVVINKSITSQQQQIPSFQQPLQLNNLVPGMRIIIKPLQATFTRDLDTFTKMDPFCEIRLGSQLKRTHAASNSGQTPHWYDSLEFIYTNDKILRVTAYDEDINSNDLIGMGTLDLQNVIYNNPGPIRKQSVSIVCNGRSAGTVLLSIQIYPGNQSNNNNGW